MARFLRLEDVKLKPRISIQHSASPNKYYCKKCDRYHLVYSNIGNEHRDCDMHKALAQAEGKEVKA